jgi:heme exporter protein D
VRIGNASVSSIGGYANWTNVSDARFKIDVKEDVLGLDFINGLRPVSYELDREAIARFNGQDHEVTQDGIRHSGFIAQEVETLMKELDYDFSGLAKPQNDKDHYGLKYAEFVVPLVQSVKEHKKLLEEKQSKIDDLEKRLSTLEAKKQ